MKASDSLDVSSGEPRRQTTTAWKIYIQNLKLPKSCVEEFLGTVLRARSATDAGRGCIKLASLSGRAGREAQGQMRRGHGRADLAVPGALWLCQASKRLETWCCSYGCLLRQPFDIPLSTSTNDHHPSCSGLRGGESRVIARLDEV